MLNIQTCAYSDAGDVKTVNQDSVLERSGIINGKAVSLCIVADGCGGMEYGEEISRLIVTFYARFWEQDLPQALKDENALDERLERLLEMTIREINDEAVSFGAQVGAKVGSTLSLLLTVNHRYFIKNVGDSRIYHCRGSRIRQLTEDQSLVADLVRSGALSRKAAKTYPKKNVLTMCIGTFEKVYTYSKRGTVFFNDLFLLCCDGLHNQLETKQMRAVLTSRKIPFDEKAEVLRKTITPGRATDNVSAVVCRFRCGKRDKIRLAMMILAAVLIIAAAYVLQNAPNAVSNLLQ